MNRAKTCARAPEAIPADNSGAKNVLYFAENALSSIQGGGIVAYAVLKGLPPEKLLGFFEYRSITPTPEYAEQFIWLGLWRRNSLAKRVADYRLGHNKWWTRLFLDGILSVRAGVHIERDFQFVLQQIRKRGFKPELVYFSGLSLRYLQLAVMAAEYFDLPMVVLHMDDWMAVDSAARGLWGGYWRSRILKMMRRAAKRSLSNTTNSPSLARVVTEMTGFEHYPANNCCSDMMEFLPDAPLPVENDIPVITYAGALILNLQGETIVKPIAGAVAELNAEGFPVHLHIYTPWEFAPIANSIAMPGAIFYKGQVNRATLAKAFWDSDFLMTTVTFRPQNLRLFKHSLSTKLSEYLSVGKPVISAGHPDWHLHQYVLENRCGWAINLDQDYKRTAIKEELKRILSTPKIELRRIGRQNRQLWEREHDVKVKARHARSVIGLSS